MTLRSFVVAGAFVLVTVAAVACSSSTSEPGTASFAGSCSKLGSRCHGVASALGQECHDLGHAGDDSACGPREAECLAACPEGEDHGDHDAGQTHDDAAAANDAAAEAAADPCPSFCTCMAATCATDAGPAFESETACLATCRGASEKGRTCIVAACEKAKTASDKAHECEHGTDPVACH